MSRKRTAARRKANAAREEALVAETAVPEPIEVAAEGSGPHGEGAVEELAAAAVEVGVESEPALDPEPIAQAEAEVVAEAEADGGALELADADPDAVDDIEVPGLPTSAASMDAHQLKQLVEALVFASERPVTLQRLRQLTRVSDISRLEQALAALAEDYKDRGLVLQQVSGGYQLRTQTRFSVWVQQLVAGRPVRLSRAQLETLAIIAYRQPITRPEIDDIRGVDSGGTLKVLLERTLIRVLGKREEVGRPILYGTTKEFLDFFSLGDLRELPTLREYSELSDESRSVINDKLGAAPVAAAPVADVPDPEPVSDFESVSVSESDSDSGSESVSDSDSESVSVSEPEPFDPELAAMEAELAAATAELAAAEAALAAAAESVSDTDADFGMADAETDAETEAEVAMADAETEPGTVSMPPMPDDAFAAMMLPAEPEAASAEAAAEAEALVAELETVGDAESDDDSPVE